MFQKNIPLNRLSIDRSSRDAYVAEHLKFELNREDINGLQPIFSPLLLTSSCPDPHRFVIELPYFDDTLRWVVPSLALANPQHLKKGHISFQGNILAVDQAAPFLDALIKQVRSRDQGDPALLSLGLVTALANLHNKKHFSKLDIEEGTHTQDGLAVYSAQYKDMVRIAFKVDPNKHRCMSITAAPVPTTRQAQSVGSDCGGRFKISDYEFRDLFSDWCKLFPQRKNLLDAVYSVDELEKGDKLQFEIRIFGQTMKFVTVVAAVDYENREAVLDVRYQENNQDFSTSYIRFLATRYDFCRPEISIMRVSNSDYIQSLSTRAQRMEATRIAAAQLGVNWKRIRFGALLSRAGIDLIGQRADEYMESP